MEPTTTNPGEEFAKRVGAILTDPALKITRAIILFEQDGAKGGQIVMHGVTILDAVAMMGRALASIHQLNEFAVKKLSPTPTTPPPLTVV